MCGEPTEKELLQEQLEFSGLSVSQIIEASLSIDTTSWFRERKKRLFEEYTQEGFDFAEVEGAWPGPLQGHRISMHRDVFSDKPLDEVLLAKFSVGAASQIPAHFKYGGWNDCPHPEVHCAVWARWFNQYGAEIVSMSHDVIEAWVPRPPNNKEAALALAWEQFLYCSDTVYQGMESVANLAGILVNSNSWYFWWD